MLNYFKHYLKSNNSVGKLALGLFFIIIAIIISSYYTIANKFYVLGLNPNKVIILTLSSLGFFFILAITVAYGFFKNRLLLAKGKLQNRIIIAFSLASALPTIIVAVFAFYLFNFGIQIWFDQKISKVLDQSIIVAQSYIAENTLQLKETALSTADDLNNMYYSLVHNQQFFAKILNAQVEMRSLSEAIVFQSATNTVIAQSSLSFSLAFSTIPIHLIQRADHNEIVYVPSDPTKIRVLIKLREYSDTYLLIGRLIDQKIIDHIDQANGAAQEYYQLKKDIFSMEIEFLLVFILIALILLFIAISLGVLFARQIVSPISRLVSATEKIQAGDLTVQIPEEDLRKDEIKSLTVAFNLMVKQINTQQKDLVIAQRALAWSDVARRVAHEIKNPLTPILLSTDRLLRKFGNEIADKEEFKKYIQMIEKHTNDIKKIVAEFVNFARLPAPSFVECELVEMMEDIVSSRRLIKDRIAYKLNYNEPKIDFICDITQINQIMINLLKNAEEALENINQKPIITVRLIKLDLEGGVIIEVEDNGPGFTRELINKATDAYVTTRMQGMGLGLAIVKKIAQDHFGKIELANVPNGGAVIRLIFNPKELKSKLK